MEARPLILSLDLLRFGYGTGRQDDSTGESGEGSDKASQLIAIASSLGLKSSIVTSDPGENFESFNHGAIDWKEKMAMAHWVVNSTSMSDRWAISGNGLVRLYDFRRTRGL